MPSLATFLTLVPLALVSAYGFKGQKVVHETHSLSTSLPKSFTLHIESTITRPAENAQVEVSVNTNAKSWKAAHDRVVSATDRIDAVLKRFSADGGVENYAAGKPTVQNDLGVVSSEANADDLAEATDAVRGNYWAYANAQAKFNSPAALGAFRQEFVEDAAVQIDWVQWSVSPANARAAQREVRQQAVREALASAQDYAEAFGVEKVQLAHFIEESVWDRDDSGPRFWKRGMDAADTPSPNVTVVLTAKAVFNLPMAIRTEL